MKVNWNKSLNGSEIRLPSVHCLLKWMIGNLKLEKVARVKNGEIAPWGKDQQSRKSKYSLIVAGSPLFQLRQMDISVSMALVPFLSSLMLTHPKRASDQCEWALLSYARRHHTQGGIAPWVRNGPPCPTPATSLDTLQILPADHHSGIHRWNTQIHKYRGTHITQIH